MLPGTAPATPGIATATGDFLKLVLPGCGDGIAAGAATVGTGAAGSSVGIGRQDLAGSGTGLPLADMDVSSGEAALTWLAEATGVEVPPAPVATPLPVVDRPVTQPRVAPLPIDIKTKPAVGDMLPIRLQARIAPPEVPVALLVGDTSVATDTPDADTGATTRDEMPVSDPAAVPVPALSLPPAILATQPAVTVAPFTGQDADVATENATAEITSSRPAASTTPVGPLVTSVEAPTTEATPAATDTPPPPVPVRPSAIEVDPVADRPTPSAAPATPVSDEALVPAAPRERSDAPAPAPAPVPTPIADRAAPPMIGRSVRPGAEAPRPRVPMQAAGASVEPAAPAPVPEVTATAAATSRRVVNAAPPLTLTSDTATTVVQTLSASAISDTPPPPISQPEVTVAPTGGATTATADSMSVVTPATPPTAAPEAPTAAQVPSAVTPVAIETTITPLNSRVSTPDERASAATPAVAAVGVTSPADIKPAVSPPVARVASDPIAPARARSGTMPAPASSTPAAVAPRAPSAVPTPVIASVATARVDAPLNTSAAATAPTSVSASVASPASATVVTTATPVTPDTVAIERDVSQPAATTVAPVAARAPAEPPAPVIASAARTFAEAIHRAVSADDRARPADPTAPVAQPQATGAISAAAVAATGQAQQQTLDMRQPHWPTAMIQHIEKLRDMADANDMRIRVVPDALGAIDVALRREGDTVQVQLTAEQPQTRALLAEAQPRLTEMAEARGLKLQHAGGNGTGANMAGQQGDRPQQQPQQRAAPIPTAPPAARRATAEADQDTEQRLA